MNDKPTYEELEKKIRELELALAEHERAKEVLRENEERYRLLAENTTDTIWVMRLDGTFTYHSPAVEKLRGYTPEEANRISLDQTMTPSTMDFIRRIFEEENSRPMPERWADRIIELEMYRKDGSKIRAEVSVRAVRDAEGNVVALQGSTRDITDRKNTEEALRSSKEFNENLILSMKDGFSVLDKNGVHILVNPALCEMTGFTQEELIGKGPPHPYWPEDELKTIEAAFQKTVRGEFQDFELAFRKKNGECFPVIVSPSCIADDAGNITSYFAAVKDISAFKKAEQEWADIFQAIGHPTLILDLDHRILDANCAAASATGKPVDDLRGKSCCEIFHSATKPPAACPLAKLRRSGTIEESEMEMEALQGTYLVVCTPVFDAQGNLEKVIHIATDITKREMAEATLRQNQQLLELVSSVQGKVIRDVTAGDIFETMLAGILDLTESEYGFMGEVLFTPENRPYLKTHALTNIAWDEKTQAFYREHAPNGLEFVNLDTLYGEALKTASPVIANDPAGDPRSGGLPEGHPLLRSFLGIPLLSNERLVGMVGIANRPDGYDESVIAFLQPVLATYISVIEFFRNRKAHRELEAQLIQSQKLESVGLLAGGVAHDFNNLLSIILGYGELMLEDLPHGHPYHESLKEIYDAAVRAKNLTRQLLAFSRKQVLEVKTLDVNDAINGFEKLIRRLLREDIEMELKLSPHISEVNADLTQLEQVLMNLIVNARDAMPEGGKLLIETDLVELDEAFASEKRGVTPGRYAMIAVTDSGVGMDAETLGKIFEPFFTTKEEAKGTGLGLSTVYGIVKQHGGSIWAYSEPGQGTTFKIYLPEATEKAVREKEPEKTPVVTVGPATVLVVEDDPAVRKLACKVLKQNGYRVMESDSPESAVDLAKMHAEEIHLLLTDVIMPNMKGPEVYRRVLELHPETRVLYMSGYPRQSISRHGVLIEGVQLLQKPFTVKTILEKVAKSLSG